MILGVISDSHDNIKNLEKVVNQLIKFNIDALIHLGDIISPFTLKFLGEKLKNKKIYAIYGNNDGDKLYLKRTADIYKIQIEEQPIILNLDGHSLFMFHGFGDLDKTLAIANSLAKSKVYSSIIFGHIHKPHLNYVNGVLILSPGEVAGIFNNPSFAIINVPSFSAKILQVE
ncbi:metallophosphoesterase [Caldisphaera sp.]|uniref:metallophosphoesterase n=1 Tax=Caldisphaera sp. TaxID=2060322 RepID=UPI003D141299